MQCGDPPPTTQLARMEPHTMLQKRSPPAPGMQGSVAQMPAAASGVRPASRGAAHWLTRPVGVSHKFAPVHAVVPQQ
jgi:hypothetical protein